jgi:hypothetical protein
VGNFRNQLGLAREIMHQLEIARDFRQLAQPEQWLLSSLKKHALALSSLLRTVARCRSRISWLRCGNANSKLFHSHARHRKKKNFIAKLKTDDQVLTGHETKPRQSGSSIRHCLELVRIEPALLTLQPWVSHSMISVC